MSDGLGYFYFVLPSKDSTIISTLLFKIDSISSLALKKFINKVYQLVEILNLYSSLYVASPSKVYPLPFRF
jgi:hypothetical protein